MDNTDPQKIVSTITYAEKIRALVKKFWSIQFFRFLLVGGINTLFGYLIFSVLILLKLHFSIASLLGTILGVIFNYFTTGRIVFNHRDTRLIVKFFGVYGITYLVNLFFLNIFDKLHMNMLLAGAILIFPIALLSYFLNKKFVFKGTNGANTN